MNESELRDGLREALATSERPPPMRAEAALEAGRAAHRRRRTTLAAVGAATAVVAIAIGATQVLPGGTTQSTPGGQPMTTAPVDTKPVWPTGPDGQPQQDRTASAGPRAEAGVAVLDNLLARVPVGYTVPEATPEWPADATADIDPASDPWTRMAQSQFVDRFDGVEVWEHVGSLAVSQGSATGHLMVQVMTPRNEQPQDLCQAELWNSKPGGCTVVTAAGRDVAVVDAAAGTAEDFQQWAAYRHADGTVVIVAQSTAYRGAPAPLPQPVFTAQQLAELAADDGFHVE